MSQTAIDIDAMTPSDRLDLIEQLWASLDPEDVPMPDSHRVELDRRLDAADRQAWEMTTPEALMKRLRKRSR